MFTRTAAFRIVEPNGCRIGAIWKLEIPKRPISKPTVVLRHWLAPQEENNSNASRVHHAYHKISPSRRFFVVSPPSPSPSHDPMPPEVSRCAPDKSLSRRHAICYNNTIPSTISDIEQRGYLWLYWYPGSEQALLTPAFLSITSAYPAAVESAELCTVVSTVVVFGTAGTAKDELPTATGPPVITACTVAFLFTCNCCTTVSLSRFEPAGRSII